MYFVHSPVFLDIKFLNVGIYGGNSNNNIYKHGKICAICWEVVLVLKSCTCSNDHVSYFPTAVMSGSCHTLNRFCLTEISSRLAARRSVFVL